MSAPIVIWRFTDGKAGHDNQVQGLLAALDERCMVKDKLISLSDCRKGMIKCIRGLDPFGEEEASPDLIIGAGHATHLPMLNARRIRGGRVIVLMKPTLPVAWFDLCVVPAHDHPRHADNVFITRGVMHRIRPSAQQDETQGLILIGGPSPHVRWSDAEMTAQVSTVLAASPGIRWTLVTSRRTPPGFTNRIEVPAGVSLTVVTPDQTDADWLPQQYIHAGTVWVSGDSVSMVYEAVASGARVGLLPVPYKKATDGLLTGLQHLLHDRLLTDLADWQTGSPLHRPGTTLDEAGRCADWILGHWFPDAYDRVRPDA